MNRSDMGEHNRAPSSTETYGTSILGAVAVLVARRNSIVTAAGLGAALLVGLAFVFPRSYTSYTVFISQSSPTAAGSLAGVAARLGVAPAGAGQEIGLFGLAAIARSEAVALSVVSYPYASAADESGAPRTLADLWEVSGDEQAARFAKAAKRAREDIAVRLDMEASTVTLSARASSPALANEIVVRALTTVDSIAVQARRRQAASESAFLGSRVVSAKSDVAGAEGALAGFAQRNRQFAESPLLKLEFDRLQREVELRQAVLTELVRNFESARLNEVRDTPALVPVEAPTLPALADRRYLAVRLVFGALLGALAVTLSTIAGQWWRYARAVDRQGAEALDAALTRRPNGAT